MRWLLNDRTTDVPQLLADGDTAVVPNLWALEATNVLAKAQKPNVITEASARKFLMLQSGLDFETDTTTHE